MLALLASAAFAGSPYDDLLGTKATTAADEYAIGRELVDSQLWLLGPWKDDAQQARVEGIARRVVAASDRPDLVFNVTLLNDPQINACALPGGFLFVNRGLLEKVTDDELAFVLGHELSHVILRHAASTTNLQAATLSMTALADARQANDRDAARTKETELYLMMAGHSRQLELEADLYGLLYAVRAGYPAQAAPDALELIETAVGGDMSAAELPWASHPLFSERIDQLGKGTAGLRATAAEFDAGVAWLAAGRAPAAVASFQKFLTVFPQSAAGWADLGAAWLTQANAGAPSGWVDVLPVHTTSGVTVRDASSIARDRARDALIHAVKLDPMDPVALGLLGVLARMEGDLPAARLFFERALTVTEDAAPLLVDLGNVAAQEGKVDEALRLWEKAHKAAPALAEPTVNTARAYTQQKKKKKAVEAWTALLDHPKWGPEASTQLASLGTKAAAKKAAAAGGAPGFAFATVTVTIGSEAAPAVAALGPADYALDQSEEQDGSMMYYVWYDLGAELLSEHGRVTSLAIYEPSTARTTTGLHLGSTSAEVLAAYGPAEDELPVGNEDAMEWTSRGYGAVVTEGVVTELDLFRPE
jgi:predicted Zn-dependent protease